MPSGSSVRPGKWSDVIDLYDDGEYSAIWGRYDGDPQRCLGVRWNGGPGEPGYPSQGGNPLWFVEPKFLTRAKLLWLLSQTRITKPTGMHQSIEKILQALDECE